MTNHYWRLHAKPYFILSTTIANYFTDAGNIIFHIYFNRLLACFPSLDEWKALMWKNCFGCFNHRSYLPWARTILRVYLTSRHVLGMLSSACSSPDAGNIRKRTENAWFHETNHYNNCVEGRVAFNVKESQSHWVFVASCMSTKGVK